MLFFRFFSLAFAIRTGSRLTLRDYGKTSIRFAILDENFCIVISANTVVCKVLSVFFLIFFAAKTGANSVLRSRNARWRWGKLTFRYIGLETLLQEGVLNVNDHLSCLRLIAAGGEGAAEKTATRY